MKTPTGWKDFVLAVSPQAFRSSGLVGILIKEKGLVCDILIGMYFEIYCPKTCSRKRNRLKIGKKAAASPPQSPLAAPWPLWSSCLVCEGAGGTPFGSAAWGSSSGPAAFLTVALSSICCPLMTSMLFEKKKKKALKVQVKCLKDCHGSEYLESSDWAPSFSTVERLATRLYCCGLLHCLNVLTNWLRERAGV